MSKSTNIKQSEQLHTQENVENNLNKQSSLIEREKIEGTPFTLIKTTTEQGNCYFMVMGDYKITETTKTKEEQLEKLETEKWLLIMHIAIIAVKKIQQQMKMDYEQSLHKTYADQQNKDIRNYEIEPL